MSKPLPQTFHLPFCYQYNGGLFSLNHWPHQVIQMKCHRFFFFPFQSAYDLVYIADGLCRRQVKGERTPSELTPATSLQKRVLCLRVPKFMT